MPLAGMGLPDELPLGSRPRSASMRTNARQRAIDAPAAAAIGNGMHRIRQARQRSTAGDVHVRIDASQPRSNDLALDGTGIVSRRFATCDGCIETLKVRRTCCFHAASHTSVACSPRARSSPTHRMRHRSTSPIRECRAASTQQHLVSTRRVAFVRVTTLTRTPHGFRRRLFTNLTRAAAPTHVPRAAPIRRSEGIGLSAAPRRSLSRAASNPVASVVHCNP